MKLEPVGRMEFTAEDFEPLTVPVVGYTQKFEEVITDINFVSMQPAGASMLILRSTNAAGNIANTVALEFVNMCVHPDDREKWTELIEGKDVNVTTDTVIAVYTAIGEFYANRPSKRRSGSRGGRGSSKPTTQGAAQSPVSKKKVSA